MARYATDIDLARYMIWRPHVAGDETEVFIADCIRSWEGAARRPDVLARAHWGQALMPEAITALADVALATASIFRVQATCDIDNQASARTVELTPDFEARLQQFYEANPACFDAVQGAPAGPNEAHETLHDELPAGWPFTKIWLIGDLDADDSLVAMAHVVMGQRSNTLRVMVKPLGDASLEPCLSLVERDRPEPRT